MSDLILNQAPTSLSGCPTFFVPFETLDSFVNINYDVKAQKNCADEDVTATEETHEILDDYTLYKYIILQ